jgi:hypothetical protein
MKSKISFLFVTSLASLLLGFCARTTPESSAIFEHRGEFQLVDKQRLFFFYARLFLAGIRFKEK